MIELDAKQVSDTVVKEAFILAQTKIDEICKIQRQYLSSCTVSPKTVMFNKPSSSLIEFVRGLYTDEIKNEMIGNTKVSFNDKFYEFQRLVLDVAKDHIDDETNEHFTASKIKIAVFDVVKNVIRDRTLHE